MKGNKVTSLDPSTSFITAMKTKSSFGKGGRRVSKESIASSGFLAHGKVGISAVVQVFHLSFVLSIVDQPSGLYIL